MIAKKPHNADASILTISVIFLFLLLVIPTIFSNEFLLIFILALYIVVSAFILHMSSFPVNRLFYIKAVNQFKRRKHKKKQAYKLFLHGMQFIWIVWNIRGRLFKNKKKNQKQVIFKIVLDETKKEFLEAAKIVAKKSPYETFQVDTWLVSPTTISDLRKKGIKVRHTYSIFKTLLSIALLSIVSFIAYFPYGIHNHLKYAIFWTITWKASDINMIKKIENI